MRCLAICVGVVWVGLALGQEPEGWGELWGELERRGVTDENFFARATLYTWTTTAQVEDLRAHGVLLTADASTGGKASPYHVALERLVERGAPGHEVARLLVEHGGLRKRRYAWPNPLATAVPRGGRSYGTALIQIDLKPDAVIGRFEPGDVEAPWRFVGLGGEVVPMSEVLKNPARLAAVYHMAKGEGVAEPFREYIVCNESMVARWSVGTPEIGALVASEIALLEGLLGGAMAKALVGRGKADGVWVGGVGEGGGWVERWWAVIAFDISGYQPGPVALREVIRALRLYDATPPALVHVPAVEFPTK